MKNILYISASARSFSENGGDHQSISRALGYEFLSEFKKHSNQVEVIHRDLSINPPSFIDQAFIAASFSRGELSESDKLALEESDRLIKEVEVADVIVISSPMYNYGMPAVLKAWFDQVIRINKTFSFDLARGDSPLRPILSGKEVVLLSSWGEFNFRKGEEKSGFNHLSNHVEHLAPYLGANQLHEIASEYEEFGDERHTDSKLKAMNDAKVLAKSLAA